MRGCTSLIYRALLGLLGVYLVFSALDLIGRECISRGEDTIVGGRGVLSPRQSEAGGGEDEDDGQRTSHSSARRIDIAFHTSLNRLKAGRLSSRPGNPGEHSPRNLSMTAERTQEAHEKTHSQIQGSMQNEILWKFPTTHFTGVTFGSVVKTFKENLMENVIKYSVEESSKEIKIKYPAFELPIPRFVSLGDRDLFFRNKDNKQFIKVDNPEELTGIIKMIPRGISVPVINCGWRSNLSNFIETESHNFDPLEIHLHTPVLIPIFIPDGYSFQHFMDGVLPKVIQILPLLRMDDVKLALYKMDSKVTDSILDALGILKDRLINISFQLRKRSEITSDMMINSCITPPLHPILMKTAQRLISVPVDRDINMTTANIILLSRVRNSHPDRKIKNLQEVNRFLSDRYGERLLVFTGGYDLHEAIDRFSNARLVIGVHGGAFYNINFATKHTAVLEFMPTLADGTVPGHLAHTIVWRISAALGQRYWRIPYPYILSDRGRTTINIQSLKLALDKIDHEQMVNG